VSVLYRAVFADHRRDLVPEARRLFSDWLITKEIPVDVPDTGRVEGDGQSVDVVTAEDGDLQAARFRLDEEAAGHRWSTILTVMATELEGWAWIDLERVSDDAYGPPPILGAPRLVRKFLESSACRAGSTVLSPTVRVVDETGAGDLLKELLDPGRTVPVVVASRDTADPSASSARAEALAGALVGIANVWALDGLATSVLSEELGTDLHVYGGAVRTYLPGLTIPDRYPGRHRFARRELFQPHPRRGAQVVARAMVAKAVATRPPLLFRNRVALLPGFTRHGRDAEQLLAELVAVEEERDRLQQELEWQILEAEEAAAEANDARSRVRWLEQRLGEANIFLAGVPTPEAEVPALATTCVEALDLAKRHLDLVVVGDTEAYAEGLDQHIKAGTWGRKAWQALQALQSYAKAKSAGEWSGNFLSFCRSSPPGCQVIPAEWVAAAENETTTKNPKFRRARTFSVPTGVSPDGEAYMEEHIKLEKGSDPAPRLHFWDDTGGKTGKIFVGYLGRHLPSFETN